MSNQRGADGKSVYAWTMRPTPTVLDPYASASTSPPSRTMPSQGTTIPSQGTTMPISDPSVTPNVNLDPVAPTLNMVAPLPYGQRVGDAVGTIIPGIAPFEPSNEYMVTNNSRLNQYSAEYESNKIKNGFCEYNGGTDRLEKNCNNLEKNVCASTSCCVLLGGDKCVSGDVRGPYMKSNYTDPTILNRDRYYYQGKCYGNCDDNGPSFIPPTSMPENPSINAYAPADAGPGPAPASADVNPSPLVATPTAESGLSTETILAGVSLLSILLL